MLKIRRNIDCLLQCCAYPCVGMTVYRLAAGVLSFLWAVLCFGAAHPESSSDIPWNIEGQGPDGSRYSIQAGLHREIYPVFANYASFQTASQRRFGVVTITISNPSPLSLRRTVSVQIPGWSDREIQVVELEGGATRTLVFAPTFLPRFYGNWKPMARPKRSLLHCSGAVCRTSRVRLRWAKIWAGANGCACRG
jgi:hypothetical protein